MASRSALTRGPTGIQTYVIAYVTAAHAPADGCPRTTLHPEVRRTARRCSLRGPPPFAPGWSAALPARLPCGARVRADAARHRLARPPARRRERRHAARRRRRRPPARQRRRRLALRPDRSGPDLGRRG